MRGRFWTILLDIRLTLGPFSGGLFCPFHALLSQLLLDCVRCSFLCSPFLGESRVWVKLGILDSKRLVLKKLVFNSWSLVKNLWIRKSWINFSPDRPSSPWGQGTCPAARRATDHSPPSARRWWAEGWEGLHCIAEKKNCSEMILIFEILTEIHLFLMTSSIVFFVIGWESAHHIYFFDKMHTTIH